MSDMSQPVPARGERVRGGWNGLAPSWRIVLGVVMFVVGWVVMVVPGRSLAVVAVLVGAVLLCAGVVEVVVAVRDRDAPAGARVMSVIVAVFYLIAGFLCVVWIGAATASLALLLGLAWIVGGCVALYRAATGADDRLVEAVGGVVSLLVGVVILVWPLASAVGIVWAIGGGLVVLGVVAVVSGVRGRRATPSGAVRSG